MREHSYAVGDPVIYRKPKASTSPGPRAEAIDAPTGGEMYTYVVDKFWRVTRILEDGQLELTTRRNKKHIVPPDHPALRHPNLWERFYFRHRFPNVTIQDENA